LEALTLPISSDAKSPHMVQIIIPLDEPGAPHSGSVLPHVPGFGALPFSPWSSFGELAELLAAESRCVGAKVAPAQLLGPLPSSLFSPTALLACLPPSSMHEKVFHTAWERFCSVLSPVPGLQVLGRVRTGSS